MTPDSPLLTVDEVADIVRQSPHTVRRWARDGRVASVKLPGGQIRFRRLDIAAIVAGNAPAPTEVGAA